MFIDEARVLWAAVMKQAVDDLGSPDDSVRMDARAWFVSSDPPWQEGSFAWTCAVLDLAPRLVLERLRDRIPDAVPTTWPGKKRKHLHRDVDLGTIGGYPVRIAFISGRYQLALRTATGYLALGDGPEPDISLARQKIQAYEKRHGITGRFDNTFQKDEIRISQPELFS